MNRNRKTVGRASARAVGRDRLTNARRSWNMSRIRGRDTTPEKIVRSLLRRMGRQFRLNVRISIPDPVGRKKAQKAQNPQIVKHVKDADRSIPLKTQNSKLKTAKHFVRSDIVLPKQRVAIFVHGCFWHRHRGCRNCKTPTNRREWWVKKLEGNAGSKFGLHHLSLHIKNGQSEWPTVYSRRN